MGHFSPCSNPSIAENDRERQHPHPCPKDGNMHFAQHHFSKACGYFRVYGVRYFTLYYTVCNLHWLKT